MGRRWVLLLREHLWYFSRDTLAALLAQQGFELVHARANWVHFSVTNVLVRLAQYPGWFGRHGSACGGAALAAAHRGAFSDG